MIRKLLLIPLLAGSLSLAACDPSDINPNSVNNIVSQVQAASQQICSYAPTAATVANVIATFTGGQPIVSMITTIANGICGAVAAPKSVRLHGRKRAKLPIYRGVLIRGNRV